MRATVLFPLIFPIKFTAIFFLLLFLFWLMITFFPLFHSWSLVRTFRHDRQSCNCLLFVKSVFTCCATFYAGTKTHGKFNIKVFKQVYKAKTQPSFMHNGSFLFIPHSKRKKLITLNFSHACYRCGDKCAKCLRVFV